jgi:hypothetical protein
MLIRWIWRGIVYFLARKGWEAFQRHQAAQRQPAQRQPAQPAQQIQSTYPIQPTPPAGRATRR